MRIFNLLIALRFCLWMLLQSFKFGKIDFVEDYVYHLFLVKDIFLSFMLTLVAIILLIHMKRFFPDEYDSHKWTIVIFNLAEICTNFFYFIRNLIAWRDYEQQHWMVAFFFALIYECGLRFTIQALALIYIKKSNDPLSGLN